MEKSHVSLETKLCLVTAKRYETNSLLLDRRLEKSLEKNTLTGWGISPEVQEKFDNGYIALIEILPEKSQVEPNGNILPENAYRTSNIIYLRRKVVKDIFNFDDKLFFSFVEPEVTAYLKGLMN